MKGPKHTEATNNSTVNNKTVVSSVDKGNSWKGSVTGNSGSVKVTVRSLSGLFSRSEEFFGAKKRA